MSDDDPSEGAAAGGAFSPEAELDPLASDALVVEWYRLDDSKRLVRVFVRGGVILLGGSIAAAVSLAVPDMTVSLRWSLGALGAICTVSGPLSTIVGLRRMMQREDYLVLRTDGVLDCLGHHPTRLFLWEDVEKVAVGPDQRSVDLQFRDGSVERITAAVAGIEHAELARRMETVRRKAMFGLIRRNRPL